MGKKFAFKLPPSTAEEKAAKWECDGCGKVVSGTEMDRNGRNMLKGKPSHKDGCKDHMGWMMTGGKAWHDYHDNGKHPMEHVTSQVKEAFDKRNVN